MKTKLTKWLPAVSVVAFGVLLLQAQAEGPTTNAIPVAWVNTQLILQQTPGYVQAESTFAGEMRQFQAEIQRLQSDLDSAISEFDRTSLVLTPSAREQREQELRDMQEQSTERAQQLQLQAQRRERELVGPIEERISAVIEGIRAERDIGIIFDVAGGGGVVVAADRTLDLTPTIVQRLRSSSNP